MQVWHSLEEARNALASVSTALSIGVFDGVHRGHQAVLAMLREEAERRGLYGIVLTFTQHPAILARGEAPPLLCPPDLRLEYLSELGVSGVALIPFDAGLADLSPPDFVRDWLCDALRVRLMVVGHDFRFGAGGAGEAELLASLGSRCCGLEVAVVPPVMVDGSVVSSTAIRWALSAGDIAAANRLLGRAFTVRGQVVGGSRRGRSMGFPTANITLPPGSLWPRFGVYLTRARWGGEEFFGLANVGVKPTFGRNEPGIEIHLLDFAGDLYGAAIDLEFLEFIRPERRFASAEELRAQIAADLDGARSILVQY